MTLFFVRFLLLTSTLFYYHTAQSHTLFCNDWLTGNYKGHDDYGIGQPRDTSEDDLGFQGQCRDYFPTSNERIKLERIGTDPFDAEYRITRQYCWARWPFQQQCGGPKLKSVWKNGWQLVIRQTWDPPAYESWGDTKQLSFDAGVADCQTPVTVYNIMGVSQNATICKVGVGESFPHGGTNELSRDLLCAYLATNFIGIDIKARDALIGCVSMPLKPIPPPFYEVVPSTIEPYLDNSTSMQDLIQLGSRFDQPIAIMKLPSKTGGQDDELILRYKFDGDDTVYDGSNTLPLIANYNAPQCGKFSSYPTQYCAKVTDNSPDKVCVCEDSSYGCQNGIFIGCTPRPTPQDSNLAIVGQYQTEISEDNSYPSIQVMVAHTDTSKNPILIDDQNKELYYNNDDKKYYQYDDRHNKTAVQSSGTIQFKRLKLPLDDLLLKEYYREVIGQNEDRSYIYKVSRGTASLYGLSLKAIIPQYEYDMNLIKVNIRSAKMRDCDDSGCLTDGCVVTTRENNLDSSSAPTIMPSGNRWRDTCCPNPAVSVAPDGTTASVTLDIDTMVSTCPVPPYQPTCRGSQYSNPPYLNKGQNAPPQDTSAELALCPGSYEGPIVDDKGNAAIDKICIINDTYWSDILQTPYCITMPAACDPVTIPSEQSGYATWDSNTTSGATQNGVCDIGFGFEKRKVISIKIKNGLETDAQAIADWDIANSALQNSIDQANKDNRNVQRPELIITENLQVVASEVVPTRNCISNVFSSQVQNPCVKASGCVPITKAAPVNGNMTIPSSPDPSRAYEQDAISNRGSGSISDPQRLSTNISGVCDKDYQGPINDSGLEAQPSLSCITDYYSQGSSIQVLRQFWSNDLSKGCE